MFTDCVSQAQWELGELKCRVGAKPTPEVSNSSEPDVRNKACSEHMFQSVPLLKVHCKALWAMSIMFLRHCNLNSTCERSLLIPAPLVTNVLLNLSLDLSSKFLLYLASSLCWGICTSQDGWWNKQELTSSRAISLLLASKQLRSSSTTTLILVIEALYYGPTWNGRSDLC